MDDNDFEPRFAELIVLSSMYPGQLSCLDSELQTAIDQQDYSSSNRFNQQSINALFTVDPSLEVHLILPVGFPKNNSDEFKIHCRLLDSSFDKKLQKHLNEKLQIDVLGSSENQLSLIEIIPKIIDIWNEIDKIKTDPKLVPEFGENTNNQDKISRYWIYSHHIYSSVKRKSIIDLSRTLRLNGFMLIGKPGFICVEGRQTDCDEFWSTIRQWNWQRITLIDSEHFEESTETKLIFESFQEHTDRSPIFAHLKIHNCDKIIKNFLGI